MDPRARLARRLLRESGVYRNRNGTIVAIGGCFEGRFRLRLRARKKRSFVASSRGFQTFQPLPTFSSVIGDWRMASIAEAPLITWLWRTPLFGCID